MQQSRPADQKMTKKSPDEQPWSHSVQATVDAMAVSLQKTERQLDRMAQPVRQRVLSRFPILFTLLTTFGVAATFFGFERILAEITFLHDRPWLILFIGILVLMGTGTLYKVLDRSRK